MLKGLVTVNLPKVTLARISSGMTAFACSGFLIFAILDDNGGGPNSQARWESAGKRAVSIVDRLGPDFTREWKNGQDGVDNASTQSIKSPSKPEIKQPDPKTTESPSVLSLIRENADVAPAVSSGTGRVSVIVKPGDTLFAIARRHGLKLSELARLNSIEEPYVIKVGQTLYVAR